MSEVADYMENRRWALGLSLLGLVVVLWVASGFFVNAIGQDYHKPAFITYLNTGLMVAYLPAALRAKKKDPHDQTTSQFSTRKTATLSSQFCLLWYMANLLNNASYVYTTVQSATIISCTSSFFTLIIGSWCGVEKFSLAKLWPLTMLIVGIVLVSSEDGKQETSPDNALLGNLLALGSAFLYGVYTTLLKYRVGNESNLNTKLFFGFVGLFSIVGLWPFLILLDYIGVEPFALPPNSRDWILIGLNGVVIFVSDICWVLAMLLTSPLVVTVGLSATIPLSILGEMALYHRFGSSLYFVGAALVFYSFVVINRQESIDEVPEQGYNSLHFETVEEVVEEAVHIHRVRSHST
ncbi:hypothetical protein B9G98_04158 [Wickerhamiella sorbophila]|uniref:EamA domain-containing protein n=1 Tax=Wickerhamiella sorbophila TaxID=45607 RepID=A0A2T0FNH7_9ASCO|nr:hypothetical protein B9G98_04158 [Wickerhamiella sorbophila]PRT56538.1 hypothetical protein B9G98_04158 [Wickerhamiella sorbophila]